MKVHQYCRVIFAVLATATESLAFSREKPNALKTTQALESSRTSMHRRQLLQLPSFLVVSALLLPTERAKAVGEGAERMVFREKPTAPIGALLPAVQQRLLLEAALELAKNKETEQLKFILPPLDETNPMPNQNGSQNARILKTYNPAKILRGDLLRATMNLYQTNLNYNNLLSNPSEAFDVTDPDWKKAYIRANDGLPDLKRLIGADIDMRQLLRNQIQVKIDDAAAELYAGDGGDNEELVALLQEACRNFDLWLDRVRAGDVRDALQVALAGESIPVYDSYAAGFLPPTN